MSESDLLAWIEGDIAPVDAARVEAALAQDDGLRRLAESMRRDRAGIRALDAGGRAPVSLVAEAMAQAEREALVGAAPVAGRIGPSRRIGGPAVAALAACLALAATAVVLWPAIRSNVQGGARSAGIAPSEQSPLVDAQTAPVAPVELARTDDEQPEMAIASKAGARDAVAEAGGLGAIEGPRPVSIEADAGLRAPTRARPAAPALTVIDLEAAAAVMGSTSRVTMRVRTSDPDGAVRVFEDFAASDAVVWTDPRGQRLASPLHRWAGTEGAWTEPYVLKATGELGLAWLRRVAHAAGRAEGVESVDFLLAPAAPGSPGDASQADGAIVGRRSDRGLTVLIERVAPATRP